MVILTVYLYEFKFSTTIYVEDDIADDIIVVEIYACTH